MVERELQEIPVGSQALKSELLTGLSNQSNTSYNHNRNYKNQIERLQELGRTEKLDNAVLEFEAKRKRPNQDKDLESFLISAKKDSQSTFTNLRAMTRELELVILQDNKITLQQFIDSMGRAIADHDDITNDIKTLRQSYYDYLGVVGRHCTNCNDDGKFENVRLSRKQKEKGNDIKIWSRCTLCNGTKKKLKGLAMSTRSAYLIRFDKMFRYFGLYNQIDFKNIEVNKPKKLKFKPKPLEYETLKEIIKTTTKISRKVFWQFLAQSGARVLEGCKTKKSDCIFVDENNKELRNEKGMDRIKVIIRAEKGNKTRVERETFVHVEIQDYVLKRLRSISDSDYVFHNSDTPESAESCEFSAFKTVRLEMLENGFKEMDERKPDSDQHRITVHTLRSFFISKANRMDDSSFGDAIAGHTDLMRGLYDRIDDKELLTLWKKSEKRTSLESDNSVVQEELENTVNALRSELANSQKENQTKIDEALRIERQNMKSDFESQSKELYNKIFELMDKLEQKSK